MLQFAGVICPYKRPICFDNDAEPTHLPLDPQTTNVFLDVRVMFISFQPYLRFAPQEDAQNI